MFKTGKNPFTSVFQTAHGTFRMAGKYLDNNEILARLYEEQDEPVPINDEDFTNDNDFLPGLAPGSKWAGSSAATPLNSRYVRSQVYKLRCIYETP